MSEGETKATRSTRGKRDKEAAAAATNSSKAASSGNKDTSASTKETDAAAAADTTCTRTESESDVLVEEDTTAVTEKATGTTSDLEANKKEDSTSQNDKTIETSDDDVADSDKKAEEPEEDVAGTGAAATAPALATATTKAISPPTKAGTLDNSKEIGVLPEGMAASTPSKEVIRTVYWPAADRRYDQISIEEDFTFDDETQTITAFCGKPPRNFPNTHFMRRLAGHLRLGLGRNATKEAILEKICHVHFGSAFTRPDIEDETSHISGNKRKASDAGLGGTSTVLKKRPVLLNHRGTPSKKGAASGSGQLSTEATLKARAAALTALSASLETIATTIRQAEERLQNLCQAAEINFYTALMDRSKLTNDYLRTHFAEYDQFLALQKQMVASMSELGKGNDDRAVPPNLLSVSLPTSLPTTLSAPPDQEEITNKTEV